MDNKGEIITGVCIVLFVATSWFCFAIKEKCHKQEMAELKNKCAIVQLSE